MKHFVFILLVLVSCSKKSEFLNHQGELPDQQFVQSSFDIETKEVPVDIDVLWIIDNSGSMSAIQDRVIFNANDFIQTFVQVTQVDWKMGLISTDEREEPYVGFTTPLDSREPNPVPLFQEAVQSLGTSGSASEKVFLNIKRHLEQHSFARPEAGLAVIIVTDEKEQSSNISAQDLYDFLLTQVRSPDVLRVYAALDTRSVDSNCSSYDIAYSGSKFEQIVQLTGGRTISACTNTFGLGLTQIASELTQLAKAYTIPLKARPRIETIVIRYKGTILPGGPQEDGGYWYYNELENTIYFHDLEFSTEDYDSVDIDFEIDDGYDREEEESEES